MYVRPESVTSPKGVVDDIYVIFDGGGNSYSISLLKWNGCNSLAIRWNGFDDNKGHPVVRGVPVWFLLPSELMAPILSEVVKKIDIEKEKIKFIFISIYISSLLLKENKFNYHKDIAFNEKELNELQFLLSRIDVFIDLSKDNSFGSNLNINLIKGK